MLLLLLLVIAFLLGCYEMGDSDIWWHLRGGQWILENGQVPRLDPFTFGSADREWVDIHWSYEIVLALAYRVGGVGALVLLGATVGATAFLMVLSARRHGWPVSVAVLCWMPVLILLSFRLDPRPEIFSLLYLGFYLAILWRAEERPSLLWLLPLVQFLWVNMQGLFILGPILLGLFIVARAALFFWLRSHREQHETAEETHRWKRLAGVTIAVALACLINPYFLKGVWFPFELFPKVADPNNPYKKYIDELHSPADRVKELSLSVLGKDWFFLAFYFLLLLLPLSFLYPCAWKAWRNSYMQERKARRGTELITPAESGAWFGGLVAVVAFLLLSTVTLSGLGPYWLNLLGQNVPLVLLAAGGVAAVWMNKRRPSAAVVSGVGAAVLAVYMVCLDVTILGSGRGFLASMTDSRQAAGVLFIAVVLASALVCRWGGDLFRLLLAGAFAYLAVQALQNWTRFALVAGCVLSWNFSEWAAQVQAEGQPIAWSRGARWGLGLGLCVVLVVWIATLVSDRFYLHSGLVRHFAFREEPLAFAHEAALFSGQPGLPNRALIYSLGQTGVSDFHNAPRCKPFLDGRLEMPDLQTFTTYITLEDWLERNDSRWEKAVASLGNPLLLISHESSAGRGEPSLFAHPDWCCIYFDALAAVFVLRQRISLDDFPPVDFAARHFHEPGRTSVPNYPRAPAREAKALYNLAAALALRSPSESSATFWNQRVPLLLAALDRTQVALEQDSHQADVWILRGNCFRELDSESRTPTPASREEWQVERDLGWAQATYCFQKALQCQPDSGTAWRYLAMSYARRGMIEAELAASEQWLRFDPKILPRQRTQDEANRRRFAARQSRLPSSDPLPSVFSRFVREGCPLRAIEVVERGNATSWDWPFAERVAGLYMQVGRPAEARRVWEQAQDCPSEALRHCRLACTFWVERDFDAARSHYRQGQNADPQLGEACWGLAMLHAQLGDASTAREACRRGLTLSLTSRQHATLTALDRFLSPYADHP